MNKSKMTQLSINTAQELIDAYNGGEYHSIDAVIIDAIRAGMDLAQIVYRNEIVEDKDATIDPEEDNMYQAINWN